MSKTEALALQIKKMIKKEVKKQVRAQVTEILKEQQMGQRFVNEAVVPRQKPQINFDIRYDEPVYDDYDMTSIDGILGATKAQMSRENFEDLDAADETNMFVKDYSAVLKESYKKSNGQ
jgi:hypothetical protein